MEANTSSHDTSTNNCSNSSGTANGINNNSKQDVKRQQFTNKQRMDMYAFCVLELEMHSNKVSIKKQQQAIQRVLYQKDGQKPTHAQIQAVLDLPQQHEHQQQQQQQQQPQQLENNNLNHNQQHHHPQIAYIPIQQLTPVQAGHTSSTLILTPTDQQNAEHSVIIQHNGDGQASTQLQVLNHVNHDQQDGNQSGLEEKTLLQLQQEVAMTRKCYSDYQKTQVLTSSMLRDVQKRFSKYYPDAVVPSRSTIKHVFEKCVTHGTVENIRTPRKATKIPQGDEIEHLLIHEPQLSLRQLAQKLNVSTGTISRRCKALGLVPESVTIKHQQLATARRQKQIKQLENQSKVINSIAGPTSSRTISNGNHNN